MYLKSLEIVGFKSFAKKASLSFTAPITGIVGPNGSGKSNVAEAFRFVLGEQSIKSLRGKRGEDLIWNGGDESSRANRASVKLVFDNSRRIFKDIDFDEVIIERIVHRDNVNEYHLNGSQVRLKDISELLAGAHIGSTGHQIISQGEADRILSASIRERREMIEDALGLKVYQWKKLESLRKLEKTDDNMKQVESLRREIAPHLRFLKKQVEKVEKAEELRKDLVLLCRDYFSRESIYVDNEKKYLNQELSGPKEELRELELSLEKAKQILTDSKNKDKKSDEVINLENRLANVRQEKDSIIREFSRLEGEIGANKKAIEKEREKMKKEELTTVYLKDVEDVIKTIESYSSIDNVHRLYTEVVNLLRSFVTKHKSSSDSSFIGETERDMVLLVEQKTKYKQKFDEIVREESELNRQYEEIKRNIEREKDTNREAEKDVFRIIARQNEVRSILSGLNSRLDIVIREEENLKKEMLEAGLVIGRQAVNFKDLMNEKHHEDLGNITVNDSARNEFRVEQYNKLKQIEKLKIRLEDAGASGGADIIKEYRETEERDTFLSKEMEDLSKARNELLSLIAELDARIDLEFKTGILKINTEFQKYFALMFGGGKAELSVVRELRRKKKDDLGELSDLLAEDGTSQPASSYDVGQSSLAEDGAIVGSKEDGVEGIDVSVSLPRKKVKSLVMLSGGERALTSIALLFAISQVNPPPFIILDETDAALDEANSKKYGDMIENLSAHSQLILITHNRETMSRAGVLYGVTMGSDGASRLLSIFFEEAVKVAK